MKKFLFTFIFSTLFSFAQNTQTLLNWQVGYHSNSNDLPLKYYVSTVPGAVQLDLMVGEKMKQPYWFGNNFEQFIPYEQKWFTYKTSFDKPVLKTGQKFHFVSKGIDYQFIISLNGEKIHEQEGMFTYVDLDLTSKLKDKNELTIKILPVITVAGSRQTIWHYRDNARTSVKPAVSYGWDWHPRLITRGIWDETYLETRNSTQIKEVNTYYNLNPNSKSAFFRYDAELLDGVGKMYELKLSNAAGSDILNLNGTISSDKFSISPKDSLKNLELWWPNTYGKQTLYNLSFTVKDASGTVLDKKTAKVGFRKIEMLMNEGGWIDFTEFPKPRAVAPTQIVVNGKKVFAKGSNWVHPEIFMGLATRESYEKHIKLAKEANFNIFRVWGGGVINKESFFDLCDEYGILVWQEFPLACNEYPNDPKYLDVLKQEATSIIKRVRQHASLGLWCGGNELFNEWSRMTDQHHALRLLDHLTYGIDPQTPFIMTSPLNGMGHGHYVMYEQANGGEVFQWMPKKKFTAYTEFGVPSVANIEVLKAMMPSSELFPPKRGTGWETHHAFGVWGANRWLELPFLTEYFGEIKSLEDLVAYSQLSQCEGYKCIFEESRRQKPFCAMSVNWCYQEPWPCAANNSLINWPSAPKAAYYHVGKACRPVLASARIPKWRWDEGETFSAELFMLNDIHEKVPGAKVTAKIVYDDNKTLKLLDWEFAGCNEYENAAGPTARMVLPKMKNNLFKLVVEVAGKPEYTSEYTCIYRGNDVLNAKPKIKYLNGVVE
ncbi:MAG: hypothetical protein EAZ27_10440 [Cytophagales bacterium]|nr:MAG: hypothetical protein EAZ27_10440 [Cytophagales bacterium]